MNYFFNFKNKQTLKYKLNHWIAHLCLKDTWGNTTPNRATEASMTDTPKGRGPGMASPTGTRRYMEEGSCSRAPLPDALLGCSYFETIKVDSTPIAIAQAKHCMVTERLDTTVQWTVKIAIKQLRQSINPKHPLQCITGHFTWSSMDLWSVSCSQDPISTLSS